MRVYTTHLSHVCEDARLEQATFILDLHRNAVVNGPLCSGDHPDPSWLETTPPSVPSEAILMGDFNATPDSQTYAAITGPIGIHGRRLQLADRFLDTWTLAGSSEQTRAGATTGDQEDYRRGLSAGSLPAHWFSERADLAKGL